MEATKNFCNAYEKAKEPAAHTATYERRQLAEVLKIYDNIIGWNEYGAGFFLDLGEDTNGRRAFVIRSAFFDGSIFPATDSNGDPDGTRITENITACGFRVRSLEDFAAKFGEKLGQKHCKAAETPYKLQRL